MIDRFTRQQFETVLAKIANYYGMSFYNEPADSELVYRLQKTGEPTYIHIRSSIDPRTELADESGQDSIRLYLKADPQGVLTRAGSIYTQRVPGWEHRLMEKVGTVIHLQQEAGRCKKCGQLCRVYKVHKIGPNRGKLFAKCDRQERRGDGHTWKLVE
jgi:hypothetical protein